MSEHLYIIQLKDRCGAIDETGSVRIKPEFESLSGFSEGVAEYGMNGKYGLINNLGELITPPKFEGIRPFSEGRAVIEEGNCLGYIDRTGNVVIPVKFSNAGSFSEGLAAIQKGETELEGYIGLEGQVKIEPQFLDAGEFSEGLANVIAAPRPYKSGYIKQSGEFAIEPKFEIAYPFSEGLAVVGIVVKNACKHGVIDARGAWMQEPWFETAEAVFSEGFCPMWTKQKYGFMDRSGKVVIPCKFYNVGRFRSALCSAAVQSRGNVKEGFINKEGEWVIEPIYDWVEDFDGPLARVGLGDKWGYINRLGCYIWEPTE